EGKARTYYYDSALPGLVLSITKNGVKSYIAYRKVKGKPVRVTLGRHPDLTVEQARKKAQKAIAEMVDGVNPIHKARAEQKSKLTLREVYADYLKYRGSKLKASTIAQYENALDKHFVDWADSPMVEITRDKVSERHLQISKKSPSAANKVMKILGALFNFANGQYEKGNGESMFSDNPVKRLSHTRTWNKDVVRENKIETSDMKDWFAAMRALTESSFYGQRAAGFYFQLVLLHGVRRREMAKLKIEDINFKQKTFTIQETKSGRPLTLPLTDHARDLFKGQIKRRKKGYVFASERSKHGYIDSFNYLMDKVIEETGIQFTYHDLRRTFTTVAESLDISQYALKSLVNHSTSGDITARYVIADVERLREPLEKIQAFMLDKALD
ncbi:hypothetical protein A3715_18825, partial [Oleiphilus sp. HI0009]